MVAKQKHKHDIENDQEYENKLEHNTSNVFIATYLEAVSNE